MDATLLANGHMLVPAPAYDGNGSMGDGMLEVSEGDPLFEAWKPYITETESQ